MKILLTATVQSHIAQFHLPLIDMLKDQGYEVHVAAKNNLKEKNNLKLETPDKVYDIPFERFPISKQNIVSYRKLKVILSDNKYEVIHCNTPMAGVITRLLAKKYRKKGTKVFYTVHGFHFYKGGPKKNWLIYYPVEKWLSQITDKLITITKEDYKIASKRFKSDVFHVHGVGADAIKYIAYSERVQKKIKKELGYKDDQFLLLCIGELNKNKNQSTVIKALSRVKDEIPKIKLLLAGNGPMYNDLKTLVKDLKLTEKVEFLGYKTDLEKYINISNIIISASFREGLPLNIMEAMLCEKPVIASFNRGHKELIENGVNGYLVQPSDVNQFSKSILSLYENSILLKQMGIAGKSAVEPFKSENVIKEIKKVYEVK